MVAPAVLKMFQQRGIDVHQIFPNATAQRDNEGIEVDLLAVNGTELVATDCKSRLSVDDIDEHIGRLKKVRRMFPQWSGHRIYGAVATMVLDEGVAKYAQERGLFVIAQSGESFRAFGWKHREFDKCLRTKSSRHLAQESSG
jgi:hypothetical protein